MESGIGTMKDTLEQQSERVKGASQSLRTLIEDFLESGKTEGPDKAIPSPKLDALAQIADNLTCAEQALKSAADFFGRLKARIRS